MNYLLVPQDIAMSIIKSTIGLDNVIFVGGVADYMNLKGFVDMPINDIDLVYNDKKDLINFLEHFNVVYRNVNSNVYKEYLKEYITLDIDLKVTTVRIDLFNRTNEITDIEHGEFYGYNIKYASSNNMSKFHNDMISKLANSKDKKRLRKHSKKASYYNMLNNKK